MGVNMSQLDNSPEEGATSRRGSNREMGDANRHKPGRSEVVTDGCSVLSGSGGV